MFSKQKLEQFKFRVEVLLSTAEMMLMDIRQSLALMPGKVGDMTYMSLEINEARLEGEVKVLESHLARVNAALAEYEEVGNINE